MLPGYGSGLGPVLAAVPANKLSLIAADPTAAASEAIGAALRRRVVRGMGLTAFLRSPAVLVAGTEISRQDVISTSPTNLVELTSIRNARGVAGTRLSWLDRKLARVVPVGRPEATAAYAELMSIAEFLAESSDASRS